MGIAAFEEDILLGRCSGSPNFVYIGGFGDISAKKRIYRRF